jgi:plastocyanin
MRKTLVALIALTTLAGAACRSDGDDNGGSTGATGATGATSAAGCTADNAVDLTGDDPFVVTIQDLAFSPDCFTAASASSITIENKDSVTHTFTIDGTQVDVSIDGGQTFNGESAGLDPGTYPFHCKIHSSMTGTVIVS